MLLLRWTVLVLLAGFTARKITNNEGDVVVLDSVCGIGVVATCLSITPLPVTLRCEPWI